ncbi:amino acid adenylation domain-containing protein [Streptomyces sp. NPDC013012]|uniref:amino acid adenylation domain-containing protein n=1 Tax=Streptomyces sp. NPDC013012 TaxID=3364860 RepID=UPI0036CAAFB3
MSTPLTGPAAASPAVRRQALLESLLRAGGRGARASDAIPRVPRDRPLPLSSAQQRIWLVESLRPGTTEYVVPVGWELRGPLDVAALRAALVRVVERHEVLRTRYPAVGDVVSQLVLPSEELDFEVVDLGELPSDARTTRLDEVVERQARTPFDLGGRGPLRVRLVRFTAEHHALVLMVHHIAFDGWSIGVLAAELGALYSAFADGRPDPLPELPVQYADFAAWQREAHSGTALRGQLDYWREKLAGSTALELATDRPRPVAFDPAGATLPFTVPAEIAEPLIAWGRSRGATPFMVLLAAFQLLLSQHAGRTDVTVGTPVAGRNRVEVRDLLGFFVNTLVLRTDLSGEPTFEEAVGRVRETALEAYAHQDVPFERLVDELAPARDLSRNPLFQTMFSLHDSDTAAEFSGAGVRATALTTPWHSAKFDLMLQLTQRADGSLSGVVEYATALFERESMAVLAEHFTTLLGVAARDPKAVVTGTSLLSQRERGLLEGWNETSVAYPQGEVLHALVERQAARTPAAVAVRFEEQKLEYRELDARAEQLARRLRAAGVGPESVVAVCLHRGLELPVALLAVLKAGGAYLPLDPGYPAQRLGYMLDDSAAPVVLSTAELAATLPPHRAQVLLVDEEAAPAEIPAGTGATTRVDPLHPAYVIYTSGSTGRPKAVVTPHEGIVNRLRWMQDTYGLTGTDHVLHKTPYSFDVSVWELFWPLTTGATLVVARPDGHRDPEYLARTVSRHRITALHFVPAMLRVFLTALHPDAPLESLRLVLCSGEALPDDLAAAFHRHPATGRVRLHNLYGPTEASIDVTATACPPGEHVTIGTPVANTRVHVLDRDLAPQPLNVPGQLALAGVQLARGYLGRPALTAERFVPDPDPRHPGRRLYLTGDLARRNPDGTVTYLGRSDHQVKLHGHRIELGEVEVALREHPLVVDAAAAVQGDPGQERLTAHLVPADPDAVPDPADLRTWMRRLLPEHMVPSAWATLARLPLTPNGKLDRRLLPLVEPDGGASEFVEPRSEGERAVANAWREVLEVERVGAHDDFFALGGHSLLAGRITLRLRGTTGREVPVRALFDHSTVAELAAALPGYPELSAPVTLPLPGTRRLRR